MAAQQHQHPMHLSAGMYGRSARRMCTTNMARASACLAANVRLHATRLLAARSSAAELLVDSHSFS